MKCLNVSVSRRWLAALVVVASLTSIPACKPTDDVAPNPSAATRIGLGTSGAKVGIYLKVEWAWEGKDDYTELVTCSFPYGTAVPTLDTCDLPIPEAELFYGKLRFTIGSDDPANCEVLEFVPLWYRASLAAGFRPYWSDSEVDCSSWPPSPDCFNGVGTQIIPDFPKYGGVYILPQFVQTATYDADSANMKARGTNRWAVNDMPALSRLANQAVPEGGSGDAYIANTFHDYTVTCRDAWNEIVYQITLNITDVNSTIDHFRTWQ